MRLLLDLQACQATNRHRGIGRYSLSLAQAMAQRATGHDLGIILNSRFPNTVEPIRAAFDGIVPRQNIVVFDAPPSAAEIDPANAWLCRAAERMREAFITRFKPDVVHVASLFEGLVDDAVASIGQLPAGFGTAVTLYDLIPLMRKETYLTDPRIGNWYYRKLQALKNADLLLAISDYSRREAMAALQLTEDRIVDISCAVDSAFRPRTLSEEEAASLKNRHGLHKPFLMYTGGIDPRKNIEGLIQAFAALPAQIRTQYQLAIVCQISAQDRTRLTSLAADFGLEQYEVVFTGFVTEDDLISLYNLTTLFVFPSLHEGFGMPVLEAMSCGAPVIGSATTSIPEVIGFKDALFDPADVAAITAKIQHALTDGSFQDALRENGRKQAPRFSWDSSAQRALEAFEHLHERRRARECTTIGVKPPRPRLAYVSPLPPEKSGIADYSSELLPELTRYYDIDVVVAQDTVADPWISGNFPVRSVAWFEAHADDYDRIVYHFGNSAFHRHMFELLTRHPGVVVLHDFFLSGLLHYLEHTGHLGTFTNALYESHGYEALFDLKNEGQEACVWNYPCNKAVLDQAMGVIVHSQFSVHLAQKWYGETSADEWQVIPHLRVLPSTANRQAARERLGLKDTDFVVCSFGILGQNKLNDRLLGAWLNSPLSRDEQCHLVFVGENNPDSYGKSLTNRINASDAAAHIKITGFASQEMYRDYLAAADMAVQLRSRSRGETSGTILDCLAYGIPTIINAHGSAGDLPAEVLVKLQDKFSETELGDALVRLWKDSDLARHLSREAVAYIHSAHHPARIGQMYNDAIEQFAINSFGASYRGLIRSLGEIATPTTPTKQDLTATATSIARNCPAQAMRKILVDVSELVQRDAKSGIQRVVRNVLKVLLHKPPAGYRVEPVYDTGDGHYAYARAFTCKMLGARHLPLDDEPIETQAGDMYLGLDLLPHGVPRNRHFFTDLRNRDVSIYFVVFDLLPALRPDVFIDGAKPDFTRWLEAVIATADGLVCISRSVADELLDWITETPPKRLSPLKVGYFHLGADITARSSEMSMIAEENGALKEIRARPSILMVGTLEPRKGYAQALSAFELLWSREVDVNFVIVGKQGWMVETLVDRLRSHSEKGKHLFWFENANDEMLLNLYGSVSGLLAASEAEGFGLPLIEAAQHKLPVIARDLPVFREVAGDHAYYFNGTTPDDLAVALNDWLTLHAGHKAPPSTGIQWLTWYESTQQLLDTVEKQNWYRVIPAPSSASPADQ